MQSLGKDDMMDVRADGASWGPLLIGRVLGVFVLTLQQVFSKGRDLAYNCLVLLYSSRSVVRNSCQRLSFLVPIRLPI